MLFLFTFYLSIYITSLISLIYIVKKTFNNKITPTSLPYMIYYISKFSKLKNVYYGLVISLTGLPPFILFFIKFNILLNILGKNGFIICYIFFLALFIKMLFYLQPIYLKNIEFSLEHISITKKKISFKELFIINYLLTLLYISILFFPDLYVITNIYFI